MDADLKQFLEGMENRSEQRSQELEKRLRDYLNERIQQLREYIDERTHDTETRIVRAFGAYQGSSGVRMRKLESDVSNVNASTTEQMDAFQAKLLELETRIISLEGPQASGT
jgi:predicted PP-loop superfamily ATPase